MPMYIVRLRRVIEWEQTYEAATPEEAVDLAKLEARNGFIVDELVNVDEVQEVKTTVD